MSGELFAATPFETGLIVRGEPILLIASSIVLVSLVALSFWAILKEGKKRLSKEGLLSILALVVLFTILRFMFVPLTSRIFFDEDLYLNTGKNIAESLRACMCNAADVGGWCLDCIMNKAPSAHPFLLGIPVSFLGAVGGQAVFSLIIPALSIILAYFSGTLLFGKESAGIVAASALAAVPVFIEWSMTAAAEVTMVFFLLLSLSLMLLFSKTLSKRILFAFSASLSLLIQTKAESLLSAPIMYFGLVLLFPWKEAGVRKGAVLLALSAALAIMLSSIGLFHVSIAGKGSDWGAGEMDKFSFQNFESIFPTNAQFLLFGYPEISLHPFALTVVALAGLITLFIPKEGIFRPKEGAFLLALFSAFFLLYCFFYAGSVKYGADVRYALAYYPAIALLAGALGRLISRNGAIVLSIFLILSSLLQAAPQIARTAPEIVEAKAARDYRDYALSEISKGTLPKSCTIASHVTTLYANEGYSAVQPWYLENYELSEAVRKRTPCIIFDYGFWCTVEPFKDGQCKTISEAFLDRAISTHPSGFAFYNVT